MKNKEEFQFELLKNFHEQFAENQNHHQALVIKFLAGLAVLLVTFIYATVFQKSYLIKNGLVGKNNVAELIVNKGQFVISDNLYLWFSLLSCLILAICFLYIAQVAFIFRRDQGQISIIRHVAGGICEQIFGNYGQLRYKFLWPPDIFLVIMLIIIIFQLAISYYTLFLSEIATSITCKLVPLFGLPFGLMVVSYILYMGKYNDLIKK
ncbi:MAG: hypothetical protein ACOY3Z_05945 [Thermodesulfobacteriota bacterium]